MLGRRVHVGARQVGVERLLGEERGQPCALSIGVAIGVVDQDALDEVAGVFDRVSLVPSAVEGRSQHQVPPGGQARLPGEGWPQQAQGGEEGAVLVGAAGDVAQVEGVQVLVQALGVVVVDGAIALEKVLYGGVQLVGQRAGDGGCGKGRVERLDRLLHGPAGSLSDRGSGDHGTATRGCLPRHGVCCLWLQDQAGVAVAAAVMEGWCRRPSAESSAGGRGSAYGSVASIHKSQPVQELRALSTACHCHGPYIGASVSCPRTCVG